MQPLVPVPVGYRTSGVTHTVVGHRGRAGGAVVLSCGGVVPLQPDVSRRLTAEGECVTGGVAPQRLAGVACLTHAARTPAGAPGPPLTWAATHRRGQERSVGTMDGRTALVTGGSRGIGLAIAQSLVDRGARVVLTARKPEALAEAVESLGGPEVAVAVAGHAGDAGHRAEAVRTAVETFGSLDMLVGQRRREPRLRADGRPGPRRLPQDPRHQRRLLPRPGAGGVAGLDGRARRLGAVRRLGGRAARRRRTSAPTGSARPPSSTSPPSWRSNSARRCGSTRSRPPVVKTRFAEALYEGREAEVAAEYPAGRLGVPEDVGEAAAYLLGRRRRLGHRADARARRRAAVPGPLRSPAEHAGEDVVGPVLVAVAAPAAAARRRADAVLGQDLGQPGLLRRLGLGGGSSRTATR